MKKAGIGCAILGVLGLALTWFVFFPSTATTRGVPAFDDSADRSQVAALCETAVEQKLKSPASAKFPPQHAAAVKAIAPRTYRMVSYVDSQNGFGAVLRTNFTCEAAPTSVAWKITRLELQKP